MSTATLPTDPTQRRQALVREIIEHAHAALQDVRIAGKSVESCFVTFLGERLTKAGHLTFCGADEVAAEFHIPIDIVTWRANPPTAFAVMIDFGLSDDRIVHLDEFQPQLRSPKASLIKIFISVNRPGGLQEPSDPTQAFLYCMQEPPKGQGTASTEDEDGPF